MRYNLSNTKELDEAIDFIKASALREKTIDLKVVRQNRSLKSNAYCHLLLGICGMEWGYSLPEMKTVWKRDIAASVFVYFKNDQPFVKSSAGLDTKEMTNAIDLLKKYAAEQDLVLPESNDEEKLRYYEREISKSQYI
jgi:hypothetical protein